MDGQMMVTLGKMGGAMAFGLSAIGSGLGSGVAAVTGIAAWKKCFAQNRPAPFILVGFMAAPRSQTIYGMILMNKMGRVAEAQLAATGLVNYPALLGVGLFAGLSIGISAWTQGLAAASACDAFAETNKGVGNNFIALGVIETVAIFTMVFSYAYVAKFV